MRGKCPTRLEHSFRLRTSDFSVKRILLVAQTVAVLLAAGTLWAHHSPTAVFDMGKPVTVKGTLTKVDWFNPHISVLIEAKSGEAPAEDWKFESNPPSWFKHMGVSRADFAKFIGQPVTIGGVPARDGSHYGYMFRITFPDGNSLEFQPK
jgi:uncharacterized protein DUF6152